MFLNNNIQLIRCMKILQNMIICDRTICTNRSLSGRPKLVAPYVYHDYATCELATFTGNVSAEITLIHIYSHLRISLLPMLTISILIPQILNLITISRHSIISDIYIYIYLLFIVRGHPVIGQSTQRLFYILWSIFL